MADARPASGFLDLLGVDDFALEPDGSATLDLDLGAQHLNPGGIVHGGVHVAILDAVLGTLVTTTLEPGEWTATQSLTTDFLRPASAGRLRARGRIDRKGRLVAFVSGEVRLVEDGREGPVLARASGVWAIRRG